MIKPFAFFTCYPGEDIVAHPNKRRECWRTVRICLTEMVLRRKPAHCQNPLSTKFTVNSRSKAQVSPKSDYYKKKSS